MAIRKSTIDKIRNIETKIWLTNNMRIESTIIAHSTYSRYRAIA
jgi:hypothetical protein